MGKNRDEQRRKARAAARVAADQAPLSAASPVQARREMFARMKRCVVGIANIPADLAAAVKAAQTRRKSPLHAIQVVGSGFVYDTEGLIITAAHVVQPWVVAAQQAKAAGSSPPQPPSVVLWSELKSDGGSEVTWDMILGTVVGLVTSVATDVAVLRMADPKAAPSVHLYPAQLASTPCEEGDEIAVCGYPLGNTLHRDILSGMLLVPSFSGGIVSAVLPYSGAPAHLQQVFQLSAMVNPGNSGGPVFDTATGSVCGMAVQIHTVDLEALQRRQQQATPPQPAPGSPPTPQAKPAPSVSPTGLARAIPVNLIELGVAQMRAYEASQKAPPPRKP